MRTRPLLATFALLTGFLSLNAADEPWRVLPSGESPKDHRLGTPRNLNKDYFPMAVPRTKAEWEARRTALREQVLVSQGLWPMPEKTPLKPVIHGKIDRDEYTIEKVYFASMPGHYVTGSLYRPKGKTGKLPGVLCPHGHWANGRFFEANDAAVQKELKGQGELSAEGARYPLQARCAMLARMGCVVFHYDMVGIADSKALPHAAGFGDAEGELRLQSAMGLQTWNSIRALDFLLGLPEIDETRIGVTGASGGGTQTFMLFAVDDRPQVAFPAVMVSTAMQGGCVCENASYLRIEAGNIDIAALTAPRPLGMAAAKDWTVDIETKGLPELKALYKMLGVEENVMAKCFPQFGHNYNQVSRELMYEWMNKHLKLGLQSPIKEKWFVRVPPQQLSVFDDKHPVPQDAFDAKRLREVMTEASEKQLAALKPTDEKTLKEFRHVVGTALRSIVGGAMPGAAEIESKQVSEREVRDGLIIRRYLLGRKGANEQIPALGMTTEKFNGNVIVWIDPQGIAGLWKDGKLLPEVKQALDGGAGLLAVDVLGTGSLKSDKPMSIDARYAGYTFGYNRPLLANRVRDILTAVGFTKAYPKTKAVHLVGVQEAGPWVLMARGLCGDAVSRCAADVNGFRFDTVMTTTDPMMLPGALKYGGLPAFAALAAPGELLTYNQRRSGLGQWLKGSYQTAKATDKLKMSDETMPLKEVVAWLVK